MTLTLQMDMFVCSEGQNDTGSEAQKYCLDLTATSLCGYNSY
jgi:hypothetical protein